MTRISRLMRAFEPHPGGLLSQPVIGGNLTCWSRFSRFGCEQIEDRLSILPCVVPSERSVSVAASCGAIVTPSLKDQLCEDPQRMRVRPWCVETSRSCSRSSWATRMSGATGRSSSGHCHGRNATGRELPIGQRQILAFSDSGDGVGLLEFADNLHSSHNVCRLQETVQSKSWGQA